jgi:imidazolonepropionase-like amidohydrolase
VKTYLRVGSLIDGTGAPPARGVVLVTEGARIERVDSAGPLPPAGPSAQVYDCPTLTALPGLIDCHDHLAHQGLDLRARLGTPTSLAVLKTGRWATDTLLAGITTLRDAAGVDLGVKVAVESGLIAGPRLFISLVIITQTGGHGDLLQPAGVSSDFPRLPGVPDGIADGVDGVRRKVREVLRGGADWIKIATNGGSGSPRGGYDVRQFCLDEVCAIVEEAHDKDVRVMAHAHGGESLDMCLAAGVDTIEHGSFATDTQLKAMAERRIWMVPTFSVTERMVERIQADPSSVPAYTRAKISGVLEAKQRTFARAMELGVPIAMGTDAGGLGHGRNALELVYMVKAGMTPMQSIVASTQAAAALLGAGHDLGTLRPGRLADIILVDGDPLRDISLLADPSRIRLVMKGGAVYKTPEVPSSPLAAN